MPRVEGVEANNLKGYFRQLAVVVLQYLVQVLVMPPRHQQVIDAAVRLVDAVESVVTGILGVWVALKAVMAVHDAFGPGAAHRVGVTDHRPLRFIVEGHYLAQIVN